MASGPIADTFKAIQRILSPDVIKTTQGVYKFNITGEWLLESRIQPGSCSRSRSHILLAHGRRGLSSSGDDAGVWYIDLKNGPGSAGFGEPPNGEADVIMTLDGVDFIKMFKGGL